MQFVVNPGSGPVEGATGANAKDNMDRLVADTGLVGATWRTDPVEDEDEGRFPFIVSYQGRECTIDMPGIPLDEVRYTGEDGQNIWHFPRLYVDGSSWVWKFAVSSLRRHLTGEDSE